MLQLGRGFNAADQTEDPTEPDWIETGKDRDWKGPGKKKTGLDQTVKLWSVCGLGPPKPDRTR